MSEIDAVHALVVQKRPAVEGMDKRSQVDHVGCLGASHGQRRR